MDIDIDFKTSFDPTQITNRMVPASMVKNGELAQHPCGHYMQTVPVDDVTGLAAIPHKEAAQMGLFKIDCLHLSLLDPIQSKQEVRRLAFSPPDWSMLENPNVVSKLFQIHKHYIIVNRIQPKTVQQLADCIALIRPGKQHLIESYINATEEERENLRKQIYAKQSEGYYYKKPHAISYALTIVMQLNLLKEQGLDK